MNGIKNNLLIGYTGERRLNVNTGVIGVSQGNGSKIARTPLTAAEEKEVSGPTQPEDRLTVSSNEIISEDAAAALCRNEVEENLPIHVAAAETIIGKIGNVTLSIEWVPTTHTRIKYMQADGTPSESYVVHEKKTIGDTFWSDCKYDSRPYEIIEADPFEVSGCRGDKRKLTAKQGNNVITSMEVGFDPKIGISLEEMRGLSTMDAFQAVSEGSIHMHPSQNYALLCKYKDGNTTGEVRFKRLPLVQDQSQMPKRIFWDFNTINDFDVRKLI